MTSDGRAVDPVGEVTSSVHDTGLVLFDTGSGRLFASNRVGASIWRGLERRLSVEAIAAEISREYGIGLDTGRQDILRFVDQLEQARLVEPRLGS